MRVRAPSATPTERPPGRFVLPSPSHAPRANQHPLTWKPRHRWRQRCAAAVEGASASSGRDPIGVRSSPRERGKSARSPSRTGEPRPRPLWGDLRWGCSTVMAGPRAVMSGLQSAMMKSFALYEAFGFTPSPSPPQRCRRHSRARRGGVRGMGERRPPPFERPPAARP